MSENSKYDIRALFGQDEDDDDEPIPARNPGAAPEEEEEEADPTRTVLPKKAKPPKKVVAAAPAKPTEKKVKRLAEELSEMRFEKDKLEKLHEYSKAASGEKPEKKKKKQELPPKEKEEMDEPPSRVPDKKLVSDKKQKSKPVPEKKAAVPVPAKKAAAAEKASEEKVLPLFPHIGDMERAEAMLALAVEDAWRFRLPDGDPRKTVRDEMGNAEKATQFIERCIAFSKQLKGALITFFNEKQNTALANIITQLPSCYLCVFGGSKPIFAEKMPVCIWTGKPISEPAMVRTVSLVPKKKEKEDQAICFHIALEFLPILKCIYTAMFFTGVATAEITARFIKASAATTSAKGEDDDWKTYMQPLEKGKGGENAVADFVERSKRQLVECINMLREFLPESTFLVKTQ